MRRLLLLTALLAPLAACGGDDGPLAPARAGKFGCFSPNLATKGCMATSVYSWDLLGHITDKTQMALKLGHGMTVVAISEAPATLENGAICYSMGPEALENTTFTHNGLPMDAHDNTILRQHLGDAMPSGKKLCQTFAPDGDTIRVMATIDGQPYPGRGGEMVWAGKDDGYFLDAR